MKNKQLRRVIIVLLMSFIPIGAFGFGYFYSNKYEDNKIASTLTVDGNIKGSIVSKVSDIDSIVPGDTINKSIDILPSATAPSLIRVKIDPSWYDKEVKSNLSSDNIEFLYAENLKSEFSDVGSKDYWYKLGEYLYYMNLVTTNNEAIKLVEGIKFNGGTNGNDANQYQGMNLKIKVDLDVIQAKHKVYSIKWEVTDDELKEKLDILCETVK